VVSVKLGVNEPRFMDMERRRNPEAVTVWSARDLGVDTAWLGFEGSPTVVGAVWQAKSPERQRQFLDGTPQEKARLLAERIRRML